VGFEIGDGIDNPNGDRDAEEAEELYTCLEDVIVPAFYDRDADGIPRRWVDLVRSSMTRLTPTFSSDRMVREYVEDAYLPAAAAYRRRSADGGKPAEELLEWKRRIAASWRGLRFVSTEVSEDGEHYEFRATAYLDELTQNDVRVELYADPANEGDAPEVHRMETEGELAGSWHGYRYRVRIPKGRPADHYTPRIVPANDEAILPIEEPRVFWAG
jgi:starch phosphorylase